MHSDPLGKELSMRKYVATSVLVMLVAVLSFAAVVWYADRDDDAMHFSVEGEYGDQVSVAGWPAVEGEDGTKYVNLRPAMQRDVASNPSRQPNTAPDCDGIDCQQSG